MQIKGFLETSFVDWTGKICSVVFTPGCNFRCPFCHNHELVLAPHHFETVPEEHVLGRLKTFRGWIDGVCITGGEPTLQPDLKDFIRRLKETGVEVKLDSNGTQPEILAELAEEGLVDYVAMDVKGPLNHIDYSRASGAPAPLDAVLKSIAFLKRGLVAYEFRTTVVPGLHGEREISAMADHLGGCSLWRLQDFNPANALDESLRARQPFSSEQMKRFVQIAEEKKAPVIH
jgi:pyruvate formate lyase activating enzyme